MSNILDILDKTWQQLLDLLRRNPLLCYKEKRRTVYVDALPQTIFDTFISFPTSRGECLLHCSALRDAERPSRHSQMEFGNDENDENDENLKRYKNE